MAQLHWNEYDANAIRFQQEIDQLKAKMLETVVSRGEEWVLGFEELLREIVRTAPEPWPDIARFAVLGMDTVIRDFVDEPEDEVDV